MEKKKNKLVTYLKLALKIGLSVLAMYLVFRKIDLRTVWDLIRQSNLWWLLAAFVLFNLSKIFSAFRMKALLDSLDVRLGVIYNFRLCYVGMFYNLFLPGSVGGDGYKVVHLRKRYEVKTRHLVSSVFLDRLSGSAILVFLALLFALCLPAFFVDLPSWVYPLCAIALILAIPALALVVRFVFPAFRSAIFPVVIWSVGVQVVQVFCAITILFAYGVDSGFLIYMMLFLVSSLATMVPISFGGVGMRELVFLYASSYFPIDETAAIALGLMYFIVIALSSFIGIFVKLPEQEPLPEIPTTA